MSELEGAGELLEKARRRRKAIIIGGLVGVGFAGGLLTGFSEAESLFSGGSWPPALAIGLAFSYLAAAVGGGLAISRQTDEFETLSQYKAVAVAALAYILIYPPWFVLWMADLVREPIHWVLFLIFWTALALASLFYRFR